MARRGRDLNRYWLKGPCGVRECSHGTEYFVKAQCFIGAGLSGGRISYHDSSGDGASQARVHRQTFLGEEVFR